MFSIDDVKKLSALARIELSHEEMEKLAAELGSIVSFVDQIQKATPEDSGKKDELRNVMREDADVYPRALFSKTLLDAAPQREGNYIKVKKIISRS